MPPKGPKSAPTQSGNSSLRSRSYWNDLNEVFKTTSAQPGDIDAKALALLDALNDAGRAKEACAYLQKSLEGITREKVANWYAFTFTLLKRFDQNFYDSIREQRTKNKPHREPREDPKPVTMSAAAPTFVPGQIWPGMGGHPSVPPAMPATSATADLNATEAPKAADDTPAGQKEEGAPSKADSCGPVTEAPNTVAGEVPSAIEVK
eukprot:CAMPEP_0172719342 /NCGR_PEP_ID=MMETSP1074-20121228/75450_1 /TAXON_ID=2916 /ORGANISM="Ceratium fusus, Strain PA161109" /LENGTH=205 /DNA_ID=CAMNT_0013544683 /DNA_START=61 /DNA_END=678 /DNA_ORIENTATION=+